MDDQLLLRGSTGHVDRQMRIFRRLGVDRVRVSAFWNGSTSGNQNDATKPSGFDTTNPFDSHYSFGSLDRVVDSARRHGLKVMLSITTPAAALGHQRR